MRLTRHAQQRMRFRGIREDDVEQALWFGRRHRSGACTVYVLDKEAAHYPGPLPARLEGLVVVRSDDDVLITVYRCVTSHIRFDAPHALGHAVRIDEFLTSD